MLTKTNQQDAKHPRGCQLANVAYGANRELNLFFFVYLNSLQAPTHRRSQPKKIKKCKKLFIKRLH